MKGPMLGWYSCTTRSFCSLYARFSFVFV